MEKKNFVKKPGAKSGLPRLQPTKPADLRAIADRIRGYADEIETYAAALEHKKEPVRIQGFGMLKRAYTAMNDFAANCKKKVGQ